MHKSQSIIVRACNDARFGSESCKGEVKRMADYREELLDVCSFKTKDVIELQNAFNIAFPKTDAYMEYAKGMLHIYLRQLDVAKYRNFIDSLTIDVELKENAFGIVDRIGSYGIRGSKRAGPR